MIILRPTVHVKDSITIKNHTINRLTREDTSLSMKKTAVLSEKEEEEGDGDSNHVYDVDDDKDDKLFKSKKH